MSADPSTEVMKRLQEAIGAPADRFHFADGRFHVLQFKDQPSQGRVTFCTLGLSDVVLHQGSGPVRQELLFSCKDRYGELPIPEGLACLAGERALAGRPFLDGEIVGPAGWLGQRATVDHLMVTSPRFHPEALSNPIATEPVTGLVWLVPLTSKEADIGRLRGPEVLDHLFATKQPDLMELRRRSVG